MANRENIKSKLQSVHQKLNEKVDTNILYLIFVGLLFLLTIVMLLIDCFDEDGLLSSTRVLKYPVLLISVGVLFVRTAKNLKEENKLVKTAYADKIGNAFDGDKKLKKRLYSALKDFNRNNLKLAVTKLAKVKAESVTGEQKPIADYFTALCYRDDGQAAVAARIYREILEINPHYSPALSNLSTFYFNLQNYALALQYAEKAVDADPANPFAYQNLAGVHFQMYDLAKAEEYALQALRFKPNFQEAAALLAIIHSMRGNTALSQQYTNLAYSLGQNIQKLREAVKFQTERYAHKDLMNQRAAQWKAFTEKPCIRITLDGRYSKSILGGKINEPAPLSTDGEEMRLLAAIFCSELPENDLFPKRGVLRFYITPNDYYGADFAKDGKLNRQKGFRVLFTADEIGFRTSDAVQENDIFPINGSFHLRFTFGTDAMQPCEYTFGETVEKLLSVSNDPHMTAQDFDDEEFLEVVSESGHKMGGHPWFVQYDPREAAPEYMRYDTLLLQLDSVYGKDGEDIMFGDGGICNFFISHERLKNCDFSDVLYTWDCY